MLLPAADAVPATTTTKPELKAVLWDMDGTLVDTEPYWIAAEIDLVTAHGGTWEHADAMKLVGSALTNTAVVLQQAGVQLSVREIIDQLTAAVIAGIRTALPWRPGARELLHELHSRGIRCALVTMSERAMALEVVNALDHDYFEFLVTGEEVAHGKPHPEPYLKAVALLHESDPTLGIANCAAFEDSVPGVASAMASGVATIAIPHAVPLPEDDRRTTWSTLAGKTYDDVKAALLCHSAGAGAAL